MTLEAAWKLVQQRGPTVVLLDRAGTVMPWAEAKKRGHEMRCGIGDRYDEGSVEWDWLYIRDDGYSVASSIYLAHYIEKLHPGRWIGVMRRGDKSPKALDNVPASAV